MAEENSENKKQITVNKPKDEVKNETRTAGSAPQATDTNQTATPTPSHPNEGKWFVIHTYSGHENKAAAAMRQRIDTMNLSSKVFEVVVPMRNIVVVRHGKKEETKEKIFPGYILVRMNLDDESWLLVRTTQGVTSFIGAGNKPTPISEKEVEAITNRWYDPRRVCQAVRRLHTDRRTDRFLV